MGYILMMISSTNNIAMILQYILADGFMKFIFFLYITLEEKSDTNFAVSYLSIFGVLSNLGLPITVGFFNKINLFSTVLDNMYYVSFVTIIIASLIGVQYNFRMINHIVGQINESEFNIKNLASLILASILSFSLIFYGGL
jgi:NADH:ubiquinone oxidoreductase subunit 2 (subunit N)